MKLSRRRNSRLHGWPPTSRFPALSRVFSDTDAFSAHSGGVSMGLRLRGRGTCLACAHP